MKSSNVINSFQPSLSLCAADSQGAFTNIDKLNRHFVLSHRDHPYHQSHPIPPNPQPAGHTCHKCSGSVPLTNGSGSWSFRQWPSRCQQKFLFFLNCFAFYLSKGKFTSFYTDKSHEEFTEQLKSMVFLLFLLDDGRIRIRIWIRTSD